MAVPILFKLDRDTGNCDVMTADWLLGSGPNNSSRTTTPARGNNKKGKDSTALESIVTSIINREARKPGLGVRLFVQGCVLTGSDYSPSQLHGVGIVTAFKLIRDNAHRDCAKRFRSILSTLSKKATARTAPDYADNLVQSEAVFFFHPVLQLSDGKVVFLTDPGFAGEFQPSLQVFRGNLSFLGTVSHDTIIPADPPPSALRDDIDTNGIVAAINNDGNRNDNALDEDSVLVPRKIFASEAKKQRRTKSTTTTAFSLLIWKQCMPIGSRSYFSVASHM